MWVKLHIHLLQKIADNAPYAKNHTISTTKGVQCTNNSPVNTKYLKPKTLIIINLEHRNHKPAIENPTKPRNRELSNNSN